MSAVYGASPAKRQRRTNAEIGAVDEAIIQAVRADHPVTLRGVYYRVVSAGAVDKTELGYRLVGRELLKLRRSGAVAYSHITDGTRWVTKPKSWTALEQMLADAAASYRRALWHDQAAEVHIFTEKDAISGVVLPVTSRWDVPLGVLRGYASESFAHSVAESIRASRKAVYVYQLGDHDPSGLDAWRDFQRKVTGFLAQPEVTYRGQVSGGRQEALYTDDHGTEGYLVERRDGDFRPVHFARLAVTEDQIEEWQLPTRPTKRSDTRAASFRGESVEVDAIPARRLRALVEEAIVEHIDTAALELTTAAEDSEREILQRMIGGAA